MRRPVHPSLALAVLVAAALAPATALACPNCFGSTESNVYRMYQYSTVALSLLPFAIVGVIVAVVRSFARDAGRPPRMRRHRPARVIALRGTPPAAH